MNACMDRIEELSCFLDGEATPEEAQRIERHMRSCSGCRQAYEMMAGLGSSLSEVELLVPGEDFVARTAQAYRATLPPVGLVQRLGLGWRKLADSPLWLRWRMPEPHPIAQVMRARATRQAVPVPSMLFVLALFGVPALAMGWFAPESARWFLGLAATGLLVGLPWHHFRTEVATLASLRRGRCLEEILCTGVSAARLVDTLAGHSATVILKAGLPLVPILLLGSSAFGAESQGLAREAALAWLPALMLLFWLGSYGVQFLIAWSADEQRASLPQVLAAALVAAPVLALGAAVRPLLLSNHDLLALGALMVALVGGGLACRALAVWGLEHAPSLERATQSRKAGRRQLRLRRDSDNPILARELYRRSAQPLGLGGVALARGFTALIPALWAWALLDGGASVYWLGLLAVAALACWRTSSLTGAAVAGERERGTWETLLQTGISQRDFTSGWVQVALGTLALDLLPMAVVTLLAGLIVVGLGSLEAEYETGLLSVMALVLCLGLGWVGALAGLAASAQSQTQREANGKLMSWALYGSAASLMVYGVLYVIFQGIGLEGWLNSANPLWVPLVQQVLPMLSLSLVAAGLARHCRRILDSQLLLSDAVQPVAAPAPAASSLRKLVLLCSGFAGSSVSLVSGATWPEVHQVEADVLARVVLGGLVGLLAGLALYGLFQPLAEAVAARVRSRAARVLVAGLLGALCGLGVAQIPSAVSLLGWSGMGGHRYLFPDSTVFAWANLVWGALGGGLTGLLLGLGAALMGFAPEESSPASLKGALLRTLGRLGLAASVPAGLAVVAFGPFWSLRAIDPAQIDHLRQEVETRHRRAVSARQFLPVLYGPTTPASSWVGALDRSAQQAEPFRAMSGYCVGGNGEDQGLLRDAQATARAAVQVRSVLPRLKAALEPPCLELDDPRFQGRGANLLLVRSIAQSLAMLGRYDELQGRCEQAVEEYLTALRWSGRFAGQGVLINEMIEAACLAIASERLFVYLNVHHLSSAQARQVLAVSGSLPFSPTCFGQACDAETVHALDYLRGLREGSVHDQETAPLSWLPGFYFTYQETLYGNLYLRQRSALYRLVPPEREGFNLGWELAQAPRGSLVAWLIPNLSRAVQQYRLALSRLGALRLMAALELYRDEHGAYPEHLEELCPTYLESLPHNYLMGDGSYHYSVSAGTYRLSSAGTPAWFRGRSLSFHPWAGENQQ